MDGAGPVAAGVVDGQPVVREGLARLFERRSDVRLVAAVATVDDLAGAGDLDVVLLDPYPAGGPDLGALARLAASVPVLALSALGRPAAVLSAVRAGARGYLTKTCRPELLVAGAITVASGGFALTPDVAAGVAELLPASPPRLSHRESETLRHIARGLTHDQIATRLGVSRSTVNTYVERLRDKLRVGNKADLTRAALTVPGLLADDEPRWAGAGPTAAVVPGQQLR